MNTQKNDGAPGKGFKKTNYAAYFKKPDAYHTVPLLRQPTPPPPAILPVQRHQFGGRRRYEESDGDYGSTTKSSSSGERQSPSATLMARQQKGSVAKASSSARKTNKKKESVAVIPRKRTMDTRSSSRATALKVPKIKTEDTAGSSSKVKEKVKATNNAKRSTQATSKPTVDLTALSESESASDVNIDFLDDPVAWKKHDKRYPTANRPSTFTPTKTTRRTQDNGKINIRDLLAELEECKAKLNAQTKRVEGLEAQIEKDAMEKHEELSQREAEVNDLAGTKGDLTEQLQKMTDLAKSFEDKFKKAQLQADEAETVEAQLKAKNAENEMLKAQLAQAGDMLMSTFNTEKQQLEADKANLVELLNAEQAKCTMLEVTTAGAQADTEQMKKELHFAQMRLDQAVAEITVEADKRMDNMLNTIQTVTTERDNLLQQRDLSGAGSQPRESPVPSTGCNISDEQRLVNLRATYLVVKKKYDNLSAVAKDVVQCTQGMYLGGFGEFGKYLNNMARVLEEQEQRNGQQVGNGGGVAVTTGGGRGAPRGRLGAFR